MPEHLTYLFLELAWAVPVLGIQWLVGWRGLSQHRGALLVAVIIPTVYLSAIDSVAIANGIWALHDDRLVGWRIGDLPLEEAIFFLLTNAMVAQTVVLVGPSGSRFMIGRLGSRWVPAAKRSRISGPRESDGG